MLPANFPILSTLLFLPLVGVAIALLTPRNRPEICKTVVLGTSIVTFLVSLLLLAGFEASQPSMQFTELHAWIPQWGASYSLGIDGISLWLTLLTTFLMPLTILSAWNAIGKRVWEYFIVMLFLEMGMLGVFFSMDLFLFYIFWEVMLIPMYFMIGIWGSGRKIYAAVKFFLFTLVGSLFMLIGILALYFYHHSVTGLYTFDMQAFWNLGVPYNIQYWLFLAFFAGFAVKVPMFPLHTWLPDAHTEAPTAGSVILAGVLLKMGVYGFLRLCIPICPVATVNFVPWISALALIGIIYGALVSMVQKDVKRLVAYSSVSHLGFCMLGIFALTIQGMQGGVLQMINHGISTGALFLMVGMLYERRHTRLIADYGGIAKPAPFLMFLFLIVALSSIGLPGTNGFVGEFLILQGTFLSNKLYAILAATGVILAACYMLWMFQRVMYGKITHEENRFLPDLSLREYVVLVPLIIAIFWIGLFPRTILDSTELASHQLIQKVQAANRVAMLPDK